MEPYIPGSLILPCMFVFKVKSDGKEPPGISKFKCRYCTKGYFQKKGVHFVCTYAPVESSLVNLLIFAIATEFGCPMHGMDVSFTYLNVRLHHSIVMYVQPPPTVHVPRGYGLRLQKGLYGTMQGGNRWALHKHDKLTNLGVHAQPRRPQFLSSSRRTRHCLDGHHRERF